ncbi:hypothetical protein UlMin_018783 [Ulmus minor]
MSTAEMILPNQSLKFKLSLAGAKKHGPPEVIESQKAKRQNIDLSLAGAKKHEPPEVIESQKAKRQKIDCSMMAACSTILKNLMGDKSGWAFNQPVDPVALNIPDYFSVISKPMDLGTVKSKLEKDMYSSIEEFAADIRLTFSNAMLYNPPANDVHRMAKKLNRVFEMRWNVLKDKYNHECSKVGSGKSSSGQMKEVVNTKQNYDKKPRLVYKSVPKRSIPFEERVLRCSVKANNTEVEPSKRAKQKFQGKNLNKVGTESGNRQSCCSAFAKLSSSPTPKKCSSCCSSACRCSSLSCDSIHVSSSDLSSDRSLGRDSHVRGDAYRLDCQAKSLSTSQMSKSDPDSAGAVSSLDDEKTCPSSQLTTPVADAALGEEWNAPLLDVELSPTQALRAAMLKCRFADTILRAEQKKLPGHAGRSDPVKMKQEKERLERRQHEEKVRIEAQIRAAKAAAETKRKHRREKEREAFRISLEKMEKTASWPDAEDVEEIEMFCRHFQASHLVKSNCNARASMRACIRSPLEQLGLFLKDDYLEVEDEEAFLNGDGEEGEILAI